MTDDNNEQSAPAPESPSSTGNSQPSTNSEAPPVDRGREYTLIKRQLHSLIDRVDRLQKQE